jgi:hypothetical protein
VGTPSESCASKGWDTVCTNAAQDCYYNNCFMNDQGWGYADAHPDHDDQARPPDHGESAPDAPRTPDIQCASHPRREFLTAQTIHWATTPTSCSPSR